MSLQEEENLDTGTKKKNGHVNTEAGIGVMFHKLNSAWGCKTLEEARKVPSLEALDGMWPTP